MFKQKLEQCNHLNCYAVTFEDEWGKPQPCMAYLLILHSQHREHVIEGHNGTLQVLQNNIPRLHLRSNYMFTIEVLVPLCGEVFTAWRGSSVAKVKLWGSSFICKLTLLFESWPNHLVEITKRLPLFLFFSFRLVGIIRLTLSLLSSGNWCPNWGTLEPCLSPWQRYPADNHCLVD